MDDNLPMPEIERWLDADAADRSERLDDAIEALRARALRSLVGPELKEVLLLIEARWRSALEDGRGNLLAYRLTPDELKIRVRRIVNEGFEGGWSDLYS